MMLYNGYCITFMKFQCYKNLTKKQNPDVNSKLNVDFRYLASALFLLPEHMAETYFNILCFSFKF